MIPEGSIDYLASTSRACLMQEDVPADEEAGAEADAMAKTDNDQQKILLQAFTLTFLAEWGDRSQIATIALVSHLQCLSAIIPTTKYSGVYGACWWRRRRRRSHSALPWER